jgi:hypothetical protein
MKPLVLYCKSYSTDLCRVIRLTQSIRQFNVERLPFYISVPKAEISLFRENLGVLDLVLIADEDILSASPRIEAAQVARMPGSMAQQVVKSEFWRLGVSQAYVCLDSDAVFIRPFGSADFLSREGVPYTMLDEAHDLLEDALQQKKVRVLDAFRREADLMQQFFKREGRRYSFGPFPLVWHRDVWKSLDERYLLPKGMSFADAINMAPIESRWYGEALMAYKAIPLLPCQALFKVYHYGWQFDKDQNMGIGLEQLANLYLGVIYQSSWDRDLDWPQEGGALFSRIGRKVRRKLGRI